MITGQARAKEIMREPVSRYEICALDERLTQSMVSLALSIEALETLLVKKGILAEDELMTAARDLLKEKMEQAGAQVAVGTKIIGAT